MILGLKLPLTFLAGIQYLLWYCKYCDLRIEKGIVKDRFLFQMKQGD